MSVRRPSPQLTSVPLGAGHVVSGASGGGSELGPHRLECMWADRPWPLASAHSGAAPWSHLWKGATRLRAQRRGDLETPGVEQEAVASQSSCPLWRRRARGGLRVGWCRRKVPARSLLLGVHGMATTVRMEAPAGFVSRPLSSSSSALPEMPDLCWVLAGNPASEPRDQAGGPWEAVLAGDRPGPGPCPGSPALGRRVSANPPCPPRGQLGESQSGI